MDSKKNIDNNSDEEYINGVDDNVIVDNSSINDKNDSNKIDFVKILNDLELDLLNIEKTISLKVKDLAGRINCELKESIDLSADATSYRQLLIDDRSRFYFKIYRDMPKLKKLKKRYFEYYSQKYPIKINSTEKLKLIESDVAYQEARFEYYQNHINYLSESIKTIDHVIYSVKNKIELYNATGLD